MDLEGVGCIVTGAASGMGLATAMRLGQAGGRVVLVDRDAERAAAAARQIRGMALACDVGDLAGAYRAVLDVCMELAPVRVLVTCAAIARMEPIICPEAGEAFGRMIETIHVNLTGTLNVVRAAVSAMVRDRPCEDGTRGVIVMVASSAAHGGPVASAAYSASKGGIVSMTLPLARELGDYGIRVNTISPGPIDTPMLASLPGVLRAEVLKGTPFPKRAGRAEEFADLVLQICRNDFLNGSVIRLDGANRIPYCSQER